MSYKPNGKGKGWSKGVEYVDRRICFICGERFYVAPCIAGRSLNSGKYCSQRCRGKDMSIHKNTWPMTKNRRGNGGKRSDLNNVYFRSSWEANYARYLNLLVKIRMIVKWEFEPDTFEFPVKRGSMFYTPDFKIFNPEGTIEYHEVKGYLDQKGATKLKRMKKYYPSIELVLIDKDYYQRIAKKYKPLIDNWEGRVRIG